MSSNVKTKNKERPLSSRIKNNNIIKDQDIIPSHMKKNSNTNMKNEITYPSQHTSNYPSIDKNNRSKSVLNDSNENKIDSYNEEYSIIQKIWNNLGVTYKYQVEFDNYVNSCTEEQLKNAFLYEKRDLKRLGDALLKLSKEISSRENNIHSFRRCITSLLNNSNYLEDDENEKIKQNRESIIMNIICLVKSLRLNSVNTIIHFLKVREIVTYYNLIGKIDLKAISKEYKYDPNYLKKMRKDMKFLNDYPQLSQYFELNNSKIDPFLTNFASKNNSNINFDKINGSKVKIPMSEDLEKAIGQCRYVLLEESLFDNLQISDDIEQPHNHRKMRNINNNNVYYTNNNSLTNNRFNNSQRTQSNSKIHFFKEDELTNKKNINCLYDNFFNSSNNNNNIEEKNIITVMKNNRYGNENMNHNLEYLRKNMGKDYNYLFMGNKEKLNLIKFDGKKYLSLNNKNNYNNKKKVNKIADLGKAIGNNPIVIEREEREEKPIRKFKLKNKAIIYCENPLFEENEELKNNLDIVTKEKDRLNSEIKKLRNLIINIKKKNEEENNENEKIRIKRQKELEKKELEKEKKFKELEQEIENMNTLMEKIKEENKQKVDGMNKLMQQKREDYDKLIEKKNNEIKELKKINEEIINEKNEIIRQNEEIISERAQLIEGKKNMEEKINDFESKIKEYEVEMDNYKKLQNDYQNLGNKEIDLNNEISQLKGEIESLNLEKQNIQIDTNKQIENLINEKNQLEQNILSLNDTLKKEQNEKENLIKEKDNLINEKDNLIKEKDELISQNNNLNREINKLNNQINDLEAKIKDMKEEINILKGRSPDDNSAMVGKYIYGFYKGNLFNFISDISEDLSMDKIPGFIKHTFDLENINIFDEKTYIQGVYPKIITSNLKGSKNIAGICSLYYENYGQDGEPLILRIGALCVLEQDWEEKIENIINYIKENMIFDEIKIIIKYTPNPEKGNGLMLNPKIKNLFKKLNCIWKNIENLNDGSRRQDVRFIKDGNYFDQDQNNYKNNNNKIFGFNTLSILSLFNSPSQNNLDQAIKFENILPKKFSNIGFNRFINLLPIYTLLANNPTYKMIFSNDKDTKIFELPEDDEMQSNTVIKSINPKNQIKKISEIISNIKDLTSLKEKINSSEILKNFDINNSLFEEITKKLQEKNVDEISYNYFSMNVNLSTETNFCLKYENYYYNRISSKNIDILRDPETKNLFYLIKTKTESTFLLICQVGKRLQKELLDGHKNIYQTFMDYHPKLTSQLIKFSSFGLDTSQLKDLEKVIYIPSFKIDTHLYSYSNNDVNKKGKIIYERTGEDGYIGSMEEYFSISFEGDKDIKNSFSMIPVEDNKINMVIREPFLFGVFNINIIQNNPLQLFYVTKDHWIKIDNNK